MNNAINYMQKITIVELLKNGQQFQKSAKTDLRLAFPEEFDTSFPTFVKDGDSVRQESLNVITRDMVVARNAYIIGKDSEGNDIYNEWLIPKATVIKNYGHEVFDNLTTSFNSYKKQATVKAILLTSEVMSILKQTGDVLPIYVSWSPEPMMAKIGDYLTDGGYSISAHDMTAYDLIE